MYICSANHLLLFPIPRKTASFEGTHILAIFFYLSKWNKSMEEKAHHMPDWIVRNVSQRRASTAGTTTAFSFHLEHY
jgi:hypothetical protein